MNQSPSPHQRQHDAQVIRELFMLPSHIEALQTVEQGQAVRLIAEKNMITPIFPRRRYDTSICLQGSLKAMANFIRQTESFFASQKVKFLFEEPLVCRFIIPAQRVPLMLGVNNGQIKELMEKHQCDIVILTPQESTSIPQNEHNKFCEMVVIGDEENVAWLHNEIETIYANRKVKVLNGPPIEPSKPSFQRSSSFLYHPSAPCLPDMSSLSLSPPPQYGNLSPQGGNMYPSPPNYGGTGTGTGTGGSMYPHPHHNNNNNNNGKHSHNNNQHQQFNEPPPQHDPTQEEITMECTSTRNLEFSKDNIISRVLFFPESIDNMLTEASPTVTQDSTTGSSSGTGRKRRGRKQKKTNRFQEFLDYLGSAKRKLDIAIYNLTDDRVCTTLLRLHKKGIAIRIYTDYKMIWTMGNDINTLKSHGIPVRYFKGAGFNLMHHKFTIVDDILLINGSFNYSRNAADGNHENIFITNIPVIVQQYVAQFETIYSGGVLPQDSDSNPNGDDDDDGSGKNKSRNQSHKNH